MSAPCPPARRPKERGRCRAVQRGSPRGTDFAGPAGLRLFHRRLVSDLQGQRERWSGLTRSPGCWPTTRSRCWSATGPTGIRAQPLHRSATIGRACRSICGTNRASPSRAILPDPEARRCAARPCERGLKRRAKKMIHRMLVGVAIAGAAIASPLMAEPSLPPPFPISAPSACTAAR